MANTRGIHSAVLRSLAVIAVGGIVLAVLLFVASTIDRRPPAVATISLTQPIPDEPSRALITTSIEVDFSEPIDIETAADVLRMTPAVEGTVSWSGSTMIFTPDAPLEPAAAYEVAVEPGARDRAGNPMTELPPPFAFETAGPPTLVETVPADGTDEVGLEEPIRLGFSTLMDTASVEAALRLRPAFPHELRWTGRVLEIVPAEPLDADREYRIDVGAGAIDVAGLTLDDPVTLTFRTVAPGLEPVVVVPADGSDGIAATTPIAVAFDRPIDPDSASDGAVLTITPSVSGTLDVVDERGDEPVEPSQGTILRFSPSAPLPENTTFEVELATDVMSLGSGGLAAPVTWSFTTGATQPTLSNQIVYLSSHSGITNLWAMNPDGSAPRQLSAELGPVLDYAVAPDGSSYVVGDGARLVLADADGSGRRVLTDDAAVDFDPTYAPAGDRIAFARADATTGAGLGVWEIGTDGGDARQLALASAQAEESPGSPTPVEPDAPAPNWFRAPRYAPDGDALAAVNAAGGLAILDLVEDEAIHVEIDAMTAPLWLADGSRVLVVEGSTAPDEPSPVEAPVEPLAAKPGAVWIVERADGDMRRASFRDGARPLAAGADGRVAYEAADGAFRVADGPNEEGEAVEGIRGDRLDGAWFAPGEEAIVVATLDDAEGDPASATLERLDLRSGARSVLVNGGWRPRWLP